MLTTSVQIAARFSIAVHILTLLGAAPDQEPTSDYLAGSIGVNPVVVRRVIGMLKRAGLVATRQGKAGARLARSADQISLLDVYVAVEAVDELFSFHNNPNPACPIGAHLQNALEDELRDAQRQLETRLSQTSLLEVVQRVQTLAHVA